MSENRPDSAETDDEHWEIYVTYVDERPAIILVDLAIADQVPVTGLSKLVWLWVFLKDPDEQGFPTDEEDELLNDVEDAVTDALEGIGTRYIGRITTDGRREFYFYVNDPEPFFEIVAKAVQATSDYQFELDETDDPAWNHYQDVLYPADEDFQQIRNQHEIARLQDAGDTLTKARPVDHFANFPTAEDREAFVVAAAELGYEAVSRPLQKEETELPYSLGLLREHAVDEETIDTMTFELFELAQQFHGEYEGWTSAVTK